MNKIYLGDNHPYVKKFHATIYETKEGIFEVRWRDFDSVRQEQFFDSIKDAESYLCLLNKTCGLIDLDYFGARFYDNDKFWNE